MVGRAETVHAEAFGVTTGEVDVGVARLETELASSVGKGEALVDSVIVDVYVVVYSRTVVAVDSRVEESVKVTTQGLVERRSMAAKDLWLITAVDVISFNKVHSRLVPQLAPLQDL